MKSKDYLKKCKQIASMPTIVKFTTNCGDLKKFNARRGEYVISIRKVNYYVKLIKQEIKERIKESDEYCTGEVLDSDIKEWLNE